MFTEKNKHLIPRYGRLLNIATLATVTLFMFATSIIVAAFIIYVNAIGNVTFYGADQVLEQMGQSYQAIESELRSSGFLQLMDDINVDAHIMAAAILATINTQSSFEIYNIVFIILITFFTFIFYRYRLIDNNKLWLANTSKQTKAKSLMKHLEQCLGFAPIMSGHHTAFKQNRIWQFSKPPTLILSFTDIKSALTGQLNSVAYTVHHEFCHQLSWDISLCYLVKIISIFNAIILAIFFGFLALVASFILLSFSQLWLCFIFACFVGYKLYRFFMRHYFVFSMFKEHLADEYALLSTESIESADQAFEQLNSTKNNLHPPKKTRLEFLKTRHSTYPLKLFLYLCLIWWLGFAVFNKINLALIDITSWAEFIFIMLNLPLIYLVHCYRSPAKTIQLTRFACGFLICLILLVPIYNHSISSVYQPTLVKPFVNYFFNNLSWFHGYLAMTLFLAQRPRKKP